MIVWKKRNIEIGNIFVISNQDRARITSSVANHVCAVNPYVRETQNRRRGGSSGSYTGTKTSVPDVRRKREGLRISDRDPILKKKRNHPFPVALSVTNIFLGLK